MSGLEVVSDIAGIITVKFSRKVLSRATEVRANGKDVGEAFLCINDLRCNVSTQAIVLLISNMLQYHLSDQLDAVYD
jgi:hypothetical protein